MSTGFNRREFASFLGAALAAGVTLPGPLRRALVASHRRLFDWQAVRPGIWVGIGTGGNSVIVRHPEGVVLFDTKYFPFGGTVKREVEELAGPITMVVNTHHHPDHTGGNSVFEVPIVAHARAAERTIDTAASTIAAAAEADDVVAWASAKSGVELDPTTRSEVERFAARLGEVAPEDFAPNETFEHRYRLDPLSDEAELRHIGAGHTDNDAFLLLAEANVMISGDLLFHELHPYMDPADGSDSVGWQRSLAAMISQCDDDTIVVPGHGAVTDRTGLRAQSDYFDRLRSLVINQMDRGLPRDDIVELEVEGFEEYGFPQFLSRNLGIMYDELVPSQ